MNRLMAQRELMKGMVRNNAMPREAAERILAAERKGEDRPRLEAVEGEDGPEIRIYDYIDSWGGWWGVSASEVIDMLPDGAPSVTVRINSPGGEVTEGIAIHNVLADHSADITIIVDGMAASIASVIAMAGDRIVMNRGAEMMIHEAWGFVIGEADEMRRYAEILDKATRTAAEFYAARSGGDVAEFLEAMAAETWYSAQEAVDAGLADERVALKSKPSDDDGAQNLWDRSIFASVPRVEPDGADTPGANAPDPTSDGAPDSDEAAAMAAAEQERQRAEQVVAEGDLAFASSFLG